MKTRQEFFAWLKTQNVEGWTPEMLAYAVYLQGGIDALREETELKEGRRV